MPSVSVYGISAVNVARVMDTPSFYPWGSTTAAGLAGKCSRGWRHEGVSVERLDDEDLCRCLDGARELTRHANRATLAMFTNHPRCGASCAGTAGHTPLHLDVLRQPDCLTAPLHVWSGSFVDVGARGVCSL